jgi:hypothetical protein
MAHLARGCFVSVAKRKTWVVYSRLIRGQDDPVSAVCSQVEWDELNRDQPGGLTLVQSDIASEGDAERVARAGMPPGQRKLRQYR